MRLFLMWPTTKSYNISTEKKFWTHEIPISKNFGPTKYPREKNLRQKKYLSQKKLTRKTLHSHNTNDKKFGTTIKYC